MIFKNKLFGLIFMIGMLCVPNLMPIQAYANTKSIDITTSSVRSDLASMGEDKLSYLSDKDFIFITMSQYYDLDDNLRSYVYINLPTYLKNSVDDLCISLSTSTMNEENNITEKYAAYTLYYVNNDSSWYKYEILGLPNLDKTLRRYNLRDIYSNKDSDQFDINETFIFYGITNDTIEVFKQEVETIEITDKEVSFFCYGKESSYLSFFGFDEAMKWGATYTDSWFVFFNTDKPMDELLEIDITYKQYDYIIEFLGTCPMNSPITEEVLNERLNLDNPNISNKYSTEISYYDQTIKTITPGTTKVSSKDNWWGGYKTSYATIDNIMDLRKYNSTDESGNPFVFTEQAKKYTWGVNFLTTEKKCIGNSVSIMGQGVSTAVIDGSGISNTAILRLKYETSGIVKNCYVVDTPTDDFSGNAAVVKDEDFDWWEWILTVLILILLALLLLVLMPILSTIFRILLLPFKLIIKLIKKLFHRKE